MVSMKLLALKALVAAVEEGSLRSAARRLGLSQPALTKSIRELERELAATLLTRSNTGVVPTAQGKVLFESARAADRELSTAVDQIRQLGGAMVGDLSVAAVPLAVMMLIPETLRTFSREFPQIRLRIHEELYIEQLSRLRKGEVDVAIGPLPAGIPAGELIIEPLMPISMVVVVGKGSPWARARSLSELTEARWVFTGATTDSGYARHLFAQHGLPPPPAGALVNSTLSLLALICGGDFVGLMPQPIADHPLAANYMVSLPLREGPLVATLAAMSRPQNALTPAVRHFVAHLGRAAHHLAAAA
ncbi:MAG TPA: LysR substrate-binding domain-containing protein [Burkholderiaceae bacterium]